VRNRRELGFMEVALRGTATNDAARSEIDDVDDGARDVTNIDAFLHTGAKFGEAMSGIDEKLNTTAKDAKVC